jgi:rhamnogalacturonyl hydrolase YesR
MQIKTGANIQGIDLRLRPGLVHANNVWKQLGQELVITSGLDGEHSAGSLHYYGLAIDVRTRYFNNKEKKEAASTLRSLLASEFDVIEEGNHIHIEYDPFK